MVATPSWQPVRQIVQRHARYCLLIDFNVQRFLAVWTAVGAGVGIIVAVALLLLAGHSDKPDGLWLTGSKSDS
jgi:hypothetical protein